MLEKRTYVTAAAALLGIFIIIGLNQYVSDSNAPEGQTVILLGMNGNIVGNAIQLTVPSQTVPVGSQFRLDVSVTSITDLSGVQFGVQYDPAIIRYDSIQEGPFLDAGSNQASLFNGTLQSGLVKDIIVVRLNGTGVNGSGVIASLFFTALSTGTTTLVLNNPLLADSNANAIATPTINTNVTVPDTTQPTTPTNLRNTSTSNISVTLAWNAASDPESGILLYRVWRNNVNVGNTSALTFTNNGLTANTSYSFQVSAVNGDSLEGNRSTTILVTTDPNPPPPDTTPPSVPTNVRNGTVTNSSITILWNPSSDPETGVLAYRIYRNGTLIDNTSGTTFLNTGLIANAVYTYRVSAVNGQNLESAQSTPSLSVTTQANTPPDTTAPVLSNGQPTGARPYGTNTQVISLSTNEAATCRYSTTAGTPYTSMTSTFGGSGTTAHNATVTGLANGQSYTYYVRCQDAAGNANTADFTIAFSIDYSPGDLNQDGAVNLLDIMIVVTNIGVSPFDPRADFKVDGTVNIYDVVLLVRYIGT